MYIIIKNCVYDRQVNIIIKDIKYDSLLIYEFDSLKKTSYHY